MPRTELSKKSKYWLPREDYATARHYALRYPNWLKELKTYKGVSGLSYDKDAVQTSGNSDPTMQEAIRKRELALKVELIEECAYKADPSIYDGLIRAVCYGDTWEKLYAGGLPCGRGRFYEMKRKFYWLLAHRI